MEDEIVIKTEDAYIRIMWSSNAPCNKDAVNAIGIYTYDLNGNEHPNIEGGELELLESDDEKELKDLIPDVLSFIGLSEDTNYEFVSEEELDDIISNYC